jgi:hypothetical protein
MSNLRGSGRPLQGTQAVKDVIRWARTANLYERRDAPEFATVGVLNLDEYGEIGHPDTMGDFQLIRALVFRGLERFGEFALCWNQDLDSVVRRRNNRGQALRRHAEMVCQTLEGCLPRRQLTPPMLLPEGSEEQIDAGFVGVLGAFEIYRGKARGHRMANLRLILR